METKAYSILDIGSKRKINEDSVKIFEPENGKLLWEKGCIYIVADGVGGLNKGDVASKTVVDTVKTEYYNFASFDVKESLKFAINKANMVLINMREEDEKLASTLVCAVIKDNIAYVANVGDSRAYLYRNKKLTRKTNDHSFVGERMRMGELTEEEARLHPRKNIILRCLGDTENLEIDFFEVSLEENDKLLLCTDGLWSEIPHSVMEKTLNTKTEGNLGNLKKEVYKNGANDNIGAILIDIIKLDIVKEKVIPPRLKPLKIALGLTAAFAVIFLVLSSYFAINFYDFNKPIARIMINPAQKIGQIPAEFQFDGSTSTDNKEIVSYLWEIVGKNSERTLYFNTSSFNNKFEIPDNYDVILTCIDKYGNKSEVVIDKIIVEDKENPVITIKPLDSSNEYYLGYDKSVNFDINASDNYKLAKIKISEKQSGKLLQEFTTDEKNWNYNYSYAIKKTGDIALQITATDGHGNEFTKDFDLKIQKDKELPAIKSITVGDSNSDLIKIPKIGAIIKLSTDVEDNKEISKVEFYNGSLSLGIVKNAPYDCFWNIDTPGEYNIIVTAYDNDNNENTVERKITVIPVGYAVFADNSGQESEIYTVNLENNKKYKLTNNIYEDLSPVLSINEDLVYFVSNRSGLYKLYSMELDGRNQQQISNFESSNRILILSVISKNDLIIKFENDPNLYIFNIKNKLIIRKI